MDLRTLKYEPFSLAALKKNLLLWALAAVGGLGIGYLVGRHNAKIVQANALRMFRANRALFLLYDRELAYKAARGRYAGDLDSLLAGAKNAEPLRKTLAANVDMSTLEVKIVPQGFRLEANVLDEKRTLLQIKGPIHLREPKP